MGKDIFIAVKTNWGNIVAVLDHDAKQGYFQQYGEFDSINGAMRIAKILNKETV